MATVHAWENACRLCSEEKTEMLSIFGNEGIQRKVAQKLRACLPVLVYKTDPLPKQICQFCAARLDDAYEFREYCLGVYKAMHAKLLMFKDLEAVHIFLDAMQNSSDPCQVQLCKQKCRAPPPLVPLPAILSIENTTPSVKMPEIVQSNHSREPLPELPCEVQIKEEPSETVLRTSTDTDTSNERIFANLSLEIPYVLANDHRKSYDENEESNLYKGEKPRTSILEQVLKGTISLNDSQELKSQYGLSSKWWCAPCNNYYRTKESLIKHMQVFCPRRYTCRKCSRVFYTVEDLAKHDGTDHLKITLDFDESVTECHQCDREFVSWEMLRHHRLRDHVAKDIEIGTNTWCPPCNRFFPSIESYQNHKQLHQLDTMTKLPISSLPCISETESTRELRKENFNGGAKSLACPTCGKMVEEKDYLIKDRPIKRSAFFDSNTSKNAVRCGICLQWFSNRTEMIAHLQTHSDSDLPNNFRCGLCTKTFEEKWQLTRHEAFHERTSITTYICTACNEVFADKPSYKTHQGKHSVDKTYHCAKCNKIFFKEFSLLTHHCTGKPIFSQKNAIPKILQRSASLFSANKKYKCSKCNATFANSQSRNSHMRVHTEAHSMMKVKKKELKKKLEVEAMPKLSPETSTSSSVPHIEEKADAAKAIMVAPVKRTLIRTAEGYRCGVCQSPFILRDLAVAHLRSAHPVMPYQCPYCKKRFTTQYMFTHHIKADHPDETEN
ncbi:zinc finger protein 84-like isoform X2 [Belonocnema kinseyi]|uniref:zinc finger protein 84-like isoform X2 n=1 Tax=Belonocnema kinseyi TaxID=2817044 RepID=UPI00143CE96D|nr:zinc finger protein 84-like isoform X2 [Belonocnema kinseyi]